MTKKKKKPAKPRARKLIRWTGFALARGSMFAGGCCGSRESAESVKDEGERVIRVEVREVPRRKKARGT